MTAITDTSEPGVFRPEDHGTFRFVGRDLDRDGRVTLRYALDEAFEFAERFTIPVPRPLDADDLERVDGLLSLLHWTAGVSYYKTAIPATVVCESGAPPPAAADLLEALYSEGLGEFAYTNDLPAPPSPTFARTGAPRRRPTVAGGEPRVTVPIGGGKDSIVALEIVRRTGYPFTLFSVGDAPAITRTAQVAGAPHLIARRVLDPRIGALNRAGALNGHVPITAIVSSVALLTAALNGSNTVVMANERSASQGNLRWRGVEVNHQFSKSLRVEGLLRAAVAELAPGMEIFSILRPASEIAIARAFAKLTEYHHAFTSCNAVFRLDERARAGGWCGDCPKCRFVYLMLAPYCDPAHLVQIFGRDLLDDPAQIDGFALLASVGGNKPFECVGEREESYAALRRLGADVRWRDHVVIARLNDDLAARYEGRVSTDAQLYALASDHHIPPSFIEPMHDVLGA